MTPALHTARVSGEAFDADWIEVPSEEDDYAPAGFTADGFAKILARPSLEKRIESDLAFTRELQDKKRRAA